MTLQRPRGREGRTQLRILVAGFASAALLVGAVAPALAASPVRQAAAVPGIRKAQVKITKFTSTAKLAPVGAVTIGAPARDEVKTKIEDKGNPKQSGRYRNPTGALLSIPVVPALPVVAPSVLTGRSGAVGSDGISGAEMRYATPDGSRWNYSLEPPDMALCVGNGFVVQGVNGAIQVRNTNGVALTSVTPFNAFLGIPKEYPTGPSTGDPVCRFDPATGRFFMSQYLIWYGNMSVLAVSNSGDPTGTWTVWFSGDAGNVTLSGCNWDCFGDYPQLGIDQNGVWLTFNEFSDTTWMFTGTSILGLSKRGLTERNWLPWAPPYADAWGLEYTAGNDYPWTLQPASTPSGGYDWSSGGTQYFMATRDPDGTRDNVINVWAITNTNSLNLVFGTGYPSDPQRVGLTGQTYACECQYSAPANGASQMQGPIPYANSTGHYLVPRLNTNDDRMHPVVYSGGMLWTAATSVMQVGNSVMPTTGIAWWTVNVGTFGGMLVAGIRGQGYIGVKNSYLWFPAVAVSNSVRGVVAMTFSGPDRYPSVAYAQFNPYTGASEVRVAAAGVLPADGFTAWPPYARYGTERWGDYSAAATDERGNVWFAVEYVGPKPRAAFINWGTWVGTVYPY